MKLNIVSPLISVSSTDASLAVNVCCYVLAEHFRVVLLPEETLSRIEAQLIVDSAILLLRYADSIQSKSLRAVCMKLLKHTSSGDIP